MKENSTEIQDASTRGFDSLHPLPSENGNSVGQSVVKSEPIATEAGHWYLPDGTPYYTVVAKSTGKDRAVTIKDARKVGAVPSVTTVTKILHSRGLENYKLRQLFDALIDAKWEESEDRDSLFKRILALSQTHAAGRADEGSNLHGAIEQFLRGETIKDQRWYPHITKLVATLKQYGIDIHTGQTERSFAHPLGFGGKSDWHRTTEPLVLDFKNKPNKSKIESAIKYGASDYAMQVSAYRNGFGIPDARCANVFISSDDCEVIFIEWSADDLAAGWEKFQHLLRYWQLEKNYFPTVNQNQSHSKT